MLLEFDFCNLAPGLHRPLWATTGRPRFPHRTNPVLRVRGRPPALFLASSPNSAKRADALETQPRSKNESQKSVSYSITSSPVASSASGIRTPTGDLSLIANSYRSAFAARTGGSLGLTAAQQRLQSIRLPEI